MELYGWNEFHQNNYIHNPAYHGLPAGRVVSIKGFRHLLVTQNGEVDAELAGKLMFGSDTEALPKTGDWVVYIDYGTVGYIVDVLPRSSELWRRDPGTKAGRQVMATNIDCALIVQGLDRDFNLMRLERYIVQMIACGIRPVVVLNKSDLVTDRDNFIHEVARLQRDIPLYFCSAQTGEGLNVILEQVLLPRRTFMLTGSSGVGKSSLLNAIVGHAQQAVTTISDSTLKGRHTTTVLELFLLPNGSLLIDSPGMREFGVTSADDADLAGMFPAVEKFAGGCRFADCTHMHEKDCAVVKAVEEGELSREAYDSYVKLVREQRRFTIDAEEKKRLGRQAGKMSREASAFRRRNKY